MPVIDPGPRSVAEVCRMRERGQRLKYLFFWGHQQPHSGEIGKSCLSQWYDGCAFTVDGVTYRTAEHWMMAHVNGHAVVRLSGRCFSWLAVSRIPG